MNTSSKTINIIIADDHTIFLQAITALLQTVQHIHIVATATNGQQVLSLLQQHSVDVVLTDINMPIMDGAELVKQIHLHHPHVATLALTMHNDGRIINTLLKNGALGYVLKETNKEELLTAILTVASGRTYYSQAVNTTLINHLATATTPTLVVSPRETEILQLIAAGYTQQQIAAALYISAHTVVFHKRNLLQKLRAKNTAELIKIATDTGLIK